LAKAQSNNYPFWLKLADMTKVLEGKIAVVTGASRGIGRATAIGLAKQGAHIIALARTQGGLEELDDDIKTAGSTATLVPMDIKDYAGIDRLGAAIFERWQKLDILVGNAAILGKLTPLPHLDQKVWDDVLATNVTSNYRLLRSLDPLLRMAPHGRAVFVTSSLANKCLPYWGAYSVSKAALEAMVKTYAAEVATTNVRANLFNPGATRTKMRSEAMPGEDPLKLSTADDVAAHLIALCTDGFSETGSLYNYAPAGPLKSTIK
jgi:NAD(P)-dependent dehydrogenase (short-subunit alcohol dehydrogenase family)